MNKYRAKRTWSNLVNRWFDSRAECVRGEELHLLERAGEITDLQYQVKFVLCDRPKEKVSITIDFAYKIAGMPIYNDYKGMETREFRVKRIWLKEKQGIDILLTS